MTDFGQNGADRVTKEKGLKSEEWNEEDMKARIGQIQAISSGSFLVIALIVAVVIFLVPLKDAIEVKTTIIQRDVLSYPQIINVQLVNIKKPSISVFGSNPTGFYALTVALNSSETPTQAFVFYNVGIGLSSFILKEGSIKGVWSINASLYLLNQTENKWVNFNSLGGTINVR